MRPGTPGCASSGAWLSLDHHQGRPGPASSTSTGPRACCARLRRAVQRRRRIRGAGLIGNATGGPLAVTQPIRVGDLIADRRPARLGRGRDAAATWRRTANGAPIIVLNQLITGGGVRNDSIGREPITLRPPLWIDPAADEAAALALLAGCRRHRARRSRRPPSTGSGSACRSGAVPAALRPSTESDLRAAALAALRGAGIARAGAASPTGSGTGRRLYTRLRFGRARVSLKDRRAAALKPPTRCSVEHDSSAAAAPKPACPVRLRRTRGAAGHADHRRGGRRRVHRQRRGLRARHQRAQLADQGATSVVYAADGKTCRASSRASCAPPSRPRRCPSRSAR